MDYERTPEWDAFGPWILRVRSPAEVPRAFARFPFVFDDAHTVLKIPRDVERRAANPTMHLYDGMLIVSTDGLTYLSRRGDDFSMSRIPRHEIAALEHGGELLNCRLVVHGTDGTTVTVPYNASAEPTVAQVAVDLLGAPTVTPIVEPPDAPWRAAFVDDGVGLPNAYTDVARTIGGLDVVAAHPAATPKVTDSLLRRLVFGPPTVSGAVVGLSPERVLVVARSTWLRRGKKPDYSLRSIHLLRARITEVVTSPHPDAPDLQVTVVRASSCAIDFVLPRGCQAGAALERLAPSVVR